MRSKASYVVNELKTDSFSFYLRRMITNFNIELSGAHFEFITMNRVKLQLFQVYVMHNGTKKRFHMQLNDAGFFYITDKPACPEPYYQPEGTLNDAILKLGQI